MGHLVEFGRDPLGLLERGRLEHGSVFGFRVARRRFVCLSGPDAHAAFFGAPEDQLSAREVYQFMVPIFGRGVVYDVPHETLREQLGFLHPALRDSRMRGYVRAIQDEAERCFGRWRDGQLVDLPLAFTELTMRVASRCLLGEEVRNRIEEEFVAAYQDLQRGLNPIAFFAPGLPTPANRSRDKARKKIATIFASIIHERRRTGRIGEDFLQSVMDARYESGRPLTTTRSPESYWPHCSADTTRAPRWPLGPRCYSLSTRRWRPGSAPRSS